MGEPTFEDLDQVHGDIMRIKNVWGIYEEFQEDLAVLAKEDWVTFRSKTYRFDELLSQWQEKLKHLANNESAKASRKNQSGNMNVRIQQDVDQYRIMSPLLKWVRGEALSPDHWLELFRMLQMPRGTSLEKLTFGDILRAKDELLRNPEQLKVRHERGKRSSIVFFRLGLEYACPS